MNYFQSHNRHSTNKEQLTVAIVYVSIKVEWAYVILCNMYCIRPILYSLICKPVMRIKLAQLGSGVVSNSDFIIRAGPAKMFMNFHPWIMVIKKDFHIYRIYLPYIDTNLNNIVLFRGLWEWDLNPVLLHTTMH